MALNLRKLCISPTGRARSVIAAALILFTGCSAFFKVTPNGETPPVSAPAKPAAKAPDKQTEKTAEKAPAKKLETKPEKAKAESEKVATAKAAPTKGKVALPPPTRAPEPIAPPMEIAPPEPEPVASDSAGVQRLMRLAGLWQLVALHHPYIASRGVAWDSALVRILPTIRAARDQAQYVAAIGRLISVLDDPLTRLEYETIVPGISLPTLRAVQTADGVLILPLPVNANLDSADSLVFVEALAREPQRIVLDLRAAPVLPGASLYQGRQARMDTFIEAIGLARKLTTAPLVMSTERVRRIGGVSTTNSSGRVGDGDGGWIQRDASVVPAAATRAPRLAIMVNRASMLPRALMALVVTGRATLVAEGSSPATAIDDGSLVTTERQYVGDLVVARVRVGELVNADGTVGLIADTTVTPPVAASDSAPALRAALQIVRTGRAPRAKRAPLSTAPLARLPVAMDNQNYPTMAGRLLAGFRLWSAMRWRHANRDLYDEELDAVFLRVIPKLESARNEQQYAAAIGDLATALDDAEATLRGPSVQTWLGTSTAPFRVRYVEGRALITDIVRDSATTALGLIVGTEIVAADGFPLAAWMSEHRRIGATSNEWTRNRNQMRVIPRGPDGPALFKVRDAAGKERSINIPRRDSYNALLPRVQRPDATPLRRLDGNVGYVDLERVDQALLDSALAAFRDTRALIIDLRTDTVVSSAVGALKQVLATQPRYVEAREITRYASTSCDMPTLRLAAQNCPDERTQRLIWGQNDTTGHYRGRIVLLIDDRTQGAAERLALALEAATSVTYVGSPTAGAPSPATQLELPGSLTVGIPLVEVRRGDGSQVQRVGITPSVDVRPTVKGIRNRQDEVIERAQQWIVQQLDPPVRRKR